MANGDRGSQHFLADDVCNRRALHVSWRWRLKIAHAAYCVELYVVSSSSLSIPRRERSPRNPAIKINCERARLSIHTAVCGIVRGDFLSAGGQLACAHVSTSMLSELNARDRAHARSLLHITAHISSNTTRSTRNMSRD